MKSVRFIGGYFYTRNYTIIFVPLTPKDARAFEDAVALEEEEKGRVLSNDELADIAQAIETYE